MRCDRINWKTESCFAHVVLTLQSVDEMLKSNISDVIECKCSRCNETVPDILCTVFLTDSEESFTPYYIAGCQRRGGEGGMGRG